MKMSDNEEHKNTVLNENRDTSDSGVPDNVTWMQMELIWLLLEVLLRHFKLAVMPPNDLCSINPGLGSYWNGYRIYWIITMSSSTPGRRTCGLGKKFVYSSCILNICFYVIESCGAGQQHYNFIRQWKIRFSTINFVYFCVFYCISHINWCVDCNVYI